MEVDIKHENISLLWFTLQLHYSKVEIQTLLNLVEHKQRLYEYMYYTIETNRISFMKQTFLSPHSMNSIAVFL